MRYKVSEDGRFIIDMIGPVTGPCAFPVRTLHNFYFTSDIHRENYTVDDAKAICDWLNARHHFLYQSQASRLNSLNRENAVPFSSRGDHREYYSGEDWAHILSEVGFYTA